jgi:hypothetical protein
VAAEARAGTVRHDERRSADGSGTVARTPAGRQDRGEPGGQPRQEHADGHDRPHYQVRAVKADRTLGDTTPAGIGRKPDGDQLRGLESDRLARASSPPPADAGSLATAGLALGLLADRDGYSALIAAAFFLAADRRFADGHGKGDVVEFVAWARSRHQRFFGSSQDGQISAAWAAS